VRGTCFVAVACRGARHFAQNTNEQVVRAMKQDVLPIKKGLEFFAFLIKAAGLALSINVFGTGLAFLLQIILARHLGAEAYGVFSYVFAWMSLLIVMVSGGFSISALKFIPLYIQKGAPDQARNVINYAEHVCLQGCLVMGLAAVCFGYILSSDISHDLAMTALVASVAVPLVAYLRLRSAALRGLGLIGWALIPESIVRDGVILALIAALVIALATPITAPMSMAIFILGVTASLLVVSKKLNQVLPSRDTSKPRPGQQREWRRVSRSIGVEVLAQLLLRRIDILLVGILLDTTSAGYYAAASRISEIIQYPLAAINSIAYPHVAKLHAIGERARLQRLVSTTSVITGAGALAIGIPIIWFAPLILSQFGSSFVVATGALFWLIAAHVVNAFSGSIGALLTMTGHQNQSAIIMLCIVAISAVLNIILIPIWGISGAAIANVLSVAVWRLTLSWIIWRKLKILPGIGGLFLKPRHQP